MRQATTNFRSTVEAAYARFSNISDADAAVAPAPGKWSAKQILGHLIDSATNNYGRFVRAQFKDDLVFDGYDQEEWVAAGNYNTASWQELLDLWRGFNLQIARVMENTPDDVLTRKREKHTLFAIAYVTVDEADPATLEYFMLDYIAHLENHLRQIDGLIGNR